MNIVHLGKVFNFDRIPIPIKVDSLFLNKFNINDEDLLRVFPKCEKIYNSWLEKYEYTIPYSFSELFVEDLLPTEFFFESNTWGTYFGVSYEMLSDVFTASIRDRFKVINMNIDEFLVWRLSI